MIRDFRHYNDAFELEADVCIVGAGAAGITLALSLAGSGLRCCVLESGGRNFDAAIQSLGDVEQNDSDNGYQCHLRYLGGATNHWGGWCAPLNPLDFEPRPWVPESGWPIGADELKPYYTAAQAICGLSSLGYSTDELSGDSRDFRPFNTSRMTTRFYQFSKPPKRFGSAYGPSLEKERDVDIFLHANVTHLQASKDASSVNAAMVRTLEGKTGRVLARHFVVACGGIQNARLLLLSDKTQEQGLGNSNGLLGRYFMQHPHAPVASILTNDPDAVTRLFDRFTRNSFTVRASLGPSAAQQRQERILNCSATIDRTADPVSGYGALRTIWRDLKRGKWPEDISEKLRTVISDLDSLTSAPNWLSLYMRSEQSPNSDSRVTLSDSRDGLGLRKAKVEWQLNELDKRTVYTAARVIGEELARTKVGRVRLADWLTKKDPDWPQDLWGGCHHMGTTRMSNSPDSGVVNPDCRMHTVDNVFIAGSSVFPTSGYANPTLTITALALRLAEHIRTLYP